MKYDYDLICIGLGPAGMAVSLMGATMGLNVLGVERERIGGECMNVGCIPSKGILRFAKRLKTVRDILGDSTGAAFQPFDQIRERLKFIGEKKTKNLFENIPVIFGEAHFVDGHTIEVNGERKTARRIFIAAGTRPDLPKFPGTEKINFLTNETLFALKEVPKSMIILGGGAIACEMAQAFARLGCRITMIQRSSRILSRRDREAAEIVREQFRKEGITVLTGRLPKEVREIDGEIELTTDGGDVVRAEKILAAAGRRFDYSAMKLENAGVALDVRGNIRVNKFLQTTRANIFAVGDCNGAHLFSHAAMHQGMIALINAMSPRFLRRDFRKYVVPSTMFTEPQVSEVGMGEEELRRTGTRFETVVCRYEDYGAAIIEGVPAGFVKAFIGYSGRILGVCIVGEGSGEMINEWALVVQKRLRITDLLFLQHSFPTMGFLSKRVAETWMMKKAQNSLFKKLSRFFFRIF